MVYNVREFAVFYILLLHAEPSNKRTEYAEKMQKIGEFALEILQ